MQVYTRKAECRQDQYSGGPTIGTEILPIQKQLNVKLARPPATFWTVVTHIGDKRRSWIYPKRVHCGRFTGTNAQTP